MDRISDRPILSVILKSFKRSHLIGGNNGRGLKDVTCIETIQVLLFPRDLLHCCGIVHIIEVPVKLSDFLCRKHDLYLPSKIQTLKESALYFRVKSSLLRRVPETQVLPPRSSALQVAALVL